MKLQITLVILSCSLSTLRAQPQQTIVRISQTEFEYMRRQPVAQELLENAEKVMRMSKDLEASNVLGFLKQHEILGMISSNGTSSLEPVTTNTLIAFVPIFPEDVSALKLIRSTHDKICTIGKYLPSKKKSVILVRFDYHLSWFIQGMTVLHEGNHAKEYIEHGRDPQTQEDADADELRVWEFERRITRLVGGEHYENVVKREMSRITAGLKESKAKIGEVFADAHSYDDELELALGKSASDMDRDARRTIVSMDANFRLLEEAYAEKEVQAYKQGYILIVYDPTKREEVK